MGEKKQLNKRSRIHSIGWTALSDVFVKSTFIPSDMYRAAA